jgi:hypothetical protein
MAGVLSSIARGIGNIGRALVNNPLTRAVGKAASFLVGIPVAATAFFVGIFTVGIVKAWSVAAIKFRKVAFNEETRTKDAEREEILKNTISFFSSIIGASFYSFRKGANALANRFEDLDNQSGFGDSNAAENDTGGLDIGDNRKARKPEKTRQHITEQDVAKADRFSSLQKLPSPSPIPVEATKVPEGRAASYVVR